MRFLNLKELEEQNLLNWLKGFGMGILTMILFVLFYPILNQTTYSLKQNIMIALVCILIIISGCFSIYWFGLYIIKEFKLLRIKSKKEKVRE